MKADREAEREVERELEDWLEEEASPLPEPVMTSILEGVARHSQLGRSRALDFTRPGWRTFGVAMTAGLAVLAVVAGPAFVRDLAALIGSRSSVGQPAQEAMHWDAMRQFRELNPAPDGYGHTNVFTWLYATGQDRDPARYVPLSDFQVAENRWSEPTIPDLYIGGIVEDSLRMHPGGGGSDSQAAIVAWRAPVEAPLVIAGRIEVDASCGDGIIFSVEHGSETLERFVLRQGSQAFSIPVETFGQGEVLYFIVEPGADSACDSTWLTATIDTQ